LVFRSLLSRSPYLADLSFSVHFKSGHFFSAELCQPITLFFYLNTVEVPVPLPPRSKVRLAFFSGSLVYSDCFFSASCIQVLNDVCCAFYLGLRRPPISFIPFFLFGAVPVWIAVSSIFPTCPFFFCVSTFMSALCFLNLPLLVYFARITAFCPIICTHLPAQLLR